MILMPHLRTWFAATIVALAATPLIAASLPVTVERFEGEVVQVDGTVHSGALPGKTLPSGSQIHTGKDGRAICRMLKDQASTRHIPIVMISAYPDAHASAAAVGADAFVAKPFAIEEMLATVAALLPADPGS